MTPPPQRFKHIALVAGSTPEAREAYERLQGRYGNVEPNDADVIVALGGDGLMLQTLHKFMNSGKPFFEEYMTEDADVVLLGMGTMSTPVKVAVRKMREEGKKVGFVRLRWFRPFAGPEIAKCLERFKAIGVIDRDFSFGSPDLSGVVATELRSAMYTSAATRPPVLDFICGLGGREVTVPDVEKMTEITFEAAKGKAQPLTQWIGLRG